MFVFSINKLHVDFRNIILCDWVNLSRHLSMEKGSVNNGTCEGMTYKLCVSMNIMFLFKLLLRLLWLEIGVNDPELLFLVRYKLIMA